MLEKLHVLEEALGERQTPYFGGDSVKMVDYLIWPWFERILAMPAFAPECALDPKRFARVVRGFAISWEGERHGIGFKCG